MKTYIVDYGYDELMCRYWYAFEQYYEIITVELDEEMIYDMFNNYTKCDFLNIIVSESFSFARSILDFLLILKGDKDELTEKIKKEIEEKKNN
jgi:hypothetical protein